MSTGSSMKKFSGTAILAAALLCVGSPSLGHGASEQAHKKAKKPQPPPVELPSGPTGPVQQIPLGDIAAVPPQVTYQNNQLTIVAPNSTLADILRAVRKQTGAEIEIPAAPERVVTHLGPGPAREVVAELLNGSRFNYVLLGSPGDDAGLTRVVLVAKTGGQDPTAAPAPTLDPSLAAPNAQQPEQMPEAEAESNDDNNSDDNNTDQPPPEPEQQQGQDPNAVKTPQQMLQEMQQRQMQLQQQQPPGQPPIPGPGRPPGAPQQQDQ